jgi:phosphotransferase system  glucose/maltose/N-acetylglucosamine-specific IIC component
MPKFMITLPMLMAGGIFTGIAVADASTLMMILGITFTYLGGFHSGYCCGKECDSTSLATE